MISVTVLTKDSEKTLKKTLDSLRFFDEVVVADTGSTDQTKEIAKGYPNVNLIEIPFEGFGKSHNRASEEAKHDWILSIDSDESLTDELIDEIQNLSLDPFQVYSVPRNNYYRGKLITTCGWSPDRVVRLYNKNRTRFSDQLVHEAVIKEGVEEVKLKAALNHTPYLNVSHFLEKMQRYSDLFVKQNSQKRASHLTAFSHGFFAFFRSYILKRGLFQGGVGFEISFYNAATSYYKYLKLTL